MGRPKHVDQRGGMLHANQNATIGDGTRVYLKALGGPEPVGVQLTSVPRTPEAQRAFPGAEFDARLESLAARAAAGLPLDRDGPAEQIRGLAIECWACGRGTMDRVNLAALGWVSRPVVGLSNVHEVYCPMCFKRWGWPDE